VPQNHLNRNQRNPRNPADLQSPDQVLHKRPCRYNILLGSRAENRRETMPIELRYRDAGSGVVFICTGIVTAAEFSRANEEIYSVESLDQL